MPNFVPNRRFRPAIHPCLLEPSSFGRRPPPLTLCSSKPLRHLPRVGVYKRCQKVRRGTGCIRLRALGSTLPSGFTRKGTKGVAGDLTARLTTLFLRGIMTENKPGTCHWFMVQEAIPSTLEVPQRTYPCLSIQASDNNESSAPCRCSDINGIRVLRRNTEPG